VAAEQLVGPQGRRRARPSRPVRSRTHRRTRLADPAGPPARPRGRNWTAPTSPPADSRQRTRPSNRRRYGRCPLLAPPRAHAYRPSPLPWLPGIPPTLHDHPVWGDYLAKRSQLVTDLADQVQDHARQGDAEPIWAPPGSHPSALVGEIAVWRANGVNPQDPRPTGGTQLETLPALWKQRLDRHIARSTDSSGNARFNERQAAHTALSRWPTTTSARTKHPVSVRTGQPHPAAKPRRAAAQGALVRPIQSWHAAMAADR
jgi:hypothetical protein